MGSYKAIKINFTFYYQNSQLKLLELYHDSYTQFIIQALWT